MGKWKLTKTILLACALTMSAGYSRLVFAAASAAPDSGVPTDLPLTDAQAGAVTSAAKDVGAAGQEADAKSCSTPTVPAENDCKADCKQYAPPLGTAAAFVSCQSACLKTLTSCQGAVGTASTVCLTSTSKWIQQGAAYVSGALSLASVAGVVNQCSTMSNVMDDINMVLAAYNLVCGGADAIADSACPSVKKVTAASAGAFPPDFTGSPIAIACNKAIGNYYLNLATGAAGLLETLLRSGQSNTCSTTAATATNGTTTNPNPTTYDCTLPVNANALVCVCQATPNAAGCSAVAQNGCTCSTATGATAPVCNCTGTLSSGSVSTAQPSSTPLPVSSTATTTATTGMTPTSSYSGVTGNPNSATGSSGVGSTTGAGLGGSGITGSTVPTTLEAKKPGAGSDNSGDGGSYAAGGGGGALGGTAASAYAAYQPGGKLDPAKKTAAQAAYDTARAQIRTAASADNFTAISTCINVTCPSAGNTFGGNRP